MYYWIRFYAVLIEKGVYHGGGISYKICVYITVDISFMIEYKRRLSGIMYNGNVETENNWNSCIHTMLLVIY